MAGVLLQARQIDSKSGVLTLFDPMSTDTSSPTFEVTYKPYLLVAYGLEPGQSVTLYSIARLPTGDKECVFTFNSIAVVLTAASPIGVVALSGVYRLRADYLNNTVVIAFPQEAMHTDPSPTQSGLNSLIALRAGAFSDTLQITSKAITVTAYDLVPGNMVQVYSTYGGFRAPLTKNGQFVVLTPTNTSCVLDRSGDYEFFASVDCTLMAKANYIVFQNPYQLKGDKGEKGDSGSGSGSVAYVFTQNSPSATWTINHNLGYKPSVELLTVGGVEFDASVMHTSINQTIIDIAMPIAGSARLN